VTRKRTLLVIVQAFALVGVVAFSIPFVGVFFHTSPDDKGQRLFVDVSDLVPGEPRIIELSTNRPLIVLRANRRQLRDLAILSAHVWDSAEHAFATGVFVHWGLSTGNFGGCRLEHKPPGMPRDPATAGRSQWLGGYWAPGCEASYDYAGRAIKATRHAYASYVGKSRALRSPDFELLDDGRLAVTLDSH
jgi:hypothetical protein